MRNIGRTEPQSLWQASCAEHVAPDALEGPVSCDLAIIGGGFAGASAALEAAKMGASTCLLEAGEIGDGGSGRNVGLVNAGLWLTPETILENLGDAAGQRLISILGDAPQKVFDIIEENHIACEATRNGTLHCAHSTSGLKDLENRHRQGRALGAPLQLLAADDTRKRLGTDIYHGALFDPRTGTIQPLAYCKGLARAAQAHGARIYQHAAASSLAYSGKGWQITSGDHMVSAKNLLLATNAYHLGMGASFKPQYIPVCFSQFATAPLDPEILAQILPGEEGCWDTALVMSSFRRDKAGRLIIGGMGDINSVYRAIHQNWAVRKLGRLFPGVPLDRFDYQWQGRIAMTSDHIPKMVQFAPHALACFGYSGRGIGPGTIFGAAAARALLSGDAAALPLPPLESYSEYFTGLKAAYYETGAAAIHGTGLNP